MHKGVCNYLEDIVQRIKNTKIQSDSADPNQEQFSDICTELSNIMELNETESISKRLDIAVKVKFSNII